MKWQWRGQPVRGIVFDVDGTLYAQSPLRRAMLRKLARHYWYRPVTAYATMRTLSAYRKAQEHLRTLATPPADLAEEQFRFALGGLKVPPETGRLTIRRWMEEEPLGILRRFVHEGLPELLAEARRDRVKLGVFSDYPALEKLRAMGMEQYFDAVVCAQDPDVRRFKPDPLGIRVALERLGIERTEALYVGDRPEVDAAAANALNIPCCILVKHPSAVREIRWSEVSSYRALRSMLQAQ